MLVSRLTIHNAARCSVMPLAFDAELFPLQCTLKRWLALAHRLGWFIHHHGDDDRLAAARSSATRGAAQWKIGPIPSLSLSCLVVRKLGVTRHRAKQRAQCTPSDIGGHATCDVRTLGRGGAMCYCTFALVLIGTCQ